MTDAGACDVVIVGAGSSGSVLVARLTEDPDRRVLVLEAGPTDDIPDEAYDGTTVAASAPGSPIGWTYRTSLLAPDDEAGTRMPPREYDLVRGRLLGGSGAINGGYLIRPRRADLERWALVGGDRWSPERVAPLLSGIERDLDCGGEPGHGDAGPIPVRRAGNDPLSRAFAAAARAAGFPDEPDKNADAPEGVGPVPQNVVDGVRRGPGLQYLAPALGRPNLAVRGRTAATGVLIDDGRVTGVEVRTDGGTEVIRCGEVVLAAGAIETPKLLMLSGIGPADDLARLGIRGVADLPVGRALSDHPSITLTFAPHPNGPRPAPDGSPFPTALHLRTPGGEPIELLLGTRTLREILPALDAPDAFPLMVNLPATGTGRVALGSADPLDPPRVSYGYLATSTDREIARVAVRTAVSLLRSPEFAAVAALDDGPETAVLDDDRALDAWIARRIGTTVHSCGTAPLGPVADGEGRVHGVDGLRIADTSLLPRAPERGPALSAVLVGEVIAGAMRER